MIDRTKLPNSFEFVVTAGARARQLLAGSTPRVTVGDHKKTTVAQQEVVTGAVEKLDRAVVAASADASLDGAASGLEGTDGTRMAMEPAEVVRQ